MLQGTNDFGKTAGAWLRLAVLVSAATLAPALAWSGTRSRALPSVFDGILGDGDGAPEVSTGELKAALGDGKVVVFDARPYAEFAVSHLPGALSVAGKSGTTPALYVADVNDAIRQVPNQAARVILYCNGLYCGRSKRFAAELVQAGFTNVRRYQLGIPAWRALGGVTQVEKDALLRMMTQDATAVLVDGRERLPTNQPLRRAQSIPVGETTAAKDDGRLPMSDHNTRIFVVGSDGAQARRVAEAIVKDAFHNVSYFAGGVSELAELELKPSTAR